MCPKIVRDLPTAVGSPIFPKWLCYLDTLVGSDVVDCLGGTGGSAQFENVCLVDALNALGVPVPYVADGPFRPFTHGGPMLAQFVMELAHVHHSCVRPGKYVRWMDGHFSAVIISTEVTVIERSRTLTLRSLSQVE